MICINCRHRWHEGCTARNISKTWCDCAHREAPESAIYDPQPVPAEMTGTVVDADLFDELMKD